MTFVKTKDGKEYYGPLNYFRPMFNWFSLMGVDKRFSFDECEYVITPNERMSINKIGDCDEMLRAKEYLDDGRKYKWTEEDDNGIKQPYPEKEFEWEKNININKE